MRLLLDKILQTGIRLCMLTGIAFTVTACYAPVRDPEMEEWMRHNEDSLKVESQIQDLSAEQDSIASEVD
ncbi:MAG: hypothetical protein IK073_03170 [Paludibacteraceae bacterium]|nr:hypothetical protein [Paludibacteraceae bacterium]